MNKYDDEDHLEEYNSDEDNEFGEEDDNIGNDDLL